MPKVKITLRRSLIGQGFKAKETIKNNLKSIKNKRNEKQ